MQQGHTGEVAEAVHCEETIKDENTNTDSDEHKITVEDGKEREDAKSLTDPEENAETCISLSDAGSLETKDIKESTGYSTVQNQNSADILDATNDITSVIGQDKDKEKFSKQIIPKDETESSLDCQIAKRNILKEDVTSPTNQDQNREIVSKENTSSDKMGSLFVKDQCTEPHLVQNCVEICQSNVEVEASKAQVSNQPQLDVPTNCLNNTTVQNDTAL